jgi:2-polyprenyl-3-methyl-5-hydroxy-6-metoxy-1,4-benzoquinol methylase
MGAHDNKDLAKKEHWDAVYRSYHVTANWRPSSYEEVCLEHMFNRAIEKHRPKSVLEVGCGNTHWLGYIQQRHGLKIAGLDYSEKGCDMARSNLARQGATGTIHCADMFTATPDDVGTYDMLYSLGVVEHFEDLEHVLANLARFLNPGGLMITEIPNLASFHGALDWVWQPELYYKHKVIRKKELINAHEKAGITLSDAYYLGRFSMNIVNWEVYHRFGFFKHLVPFMRKVAGKTNQIMLRRAETGPGSAFLSPFIVFEGTKEG